MNEVVAISLIFIVSHDIYGENPTIHNALVLILKCSHADSRDEVLGATTGKEFSYSLLRSPNASKI